MLQLLYRILPGRYLKNFGLLICRQWILLCRIAIPSLVLNPDFLPTCCGLFLFLSNLKLLPTPDVLLISKRIICMPSFPALRLVILRASVRSMTFTDATYYSITNNRKIIHIRLRNSKRKRCSYSNLFIL